MVTKYMLAEEILRILSGGNTTANAKVRKEDIYASIAQVANTVLKSSYVTEELAMGERIPSGSMMVTYQSVPVTSKGDKSTAALPAMPIKLPRNMGVWSICEAGTNNYFIPVQTGHGIFVDEHKLLSQLVNRYYTTQGLEVTFNSDITLLGVEAVDITLVVMDLSQYSEWDALPLVADQEYAIKKEVLALHGMQMNSSAKLQDLNKEQRQQIQNQEQT